MAPGKRPAKQEQRRRLLPQNTPSSSQVNSSAGVPGLVVANFGPSLVVEDAQGRLYPCITRKKIEAPVCGDQVLWQPAAAGLGVVTQIQPRYSLLARPDARGRLKKMAANIQHMVIMLPAHAHLGAHDYEVIDRYVAAAELSGIAPLILINKIDLLDPSALTAVQQGLHVYAQLGYPALTLSIKQKQGLAVLLEQLKNRTSIVVGPSGAGKSSLIKTLVPDSEVRIGAVSASTGLGTHTTTVAMLYHLPQGGDLIDSPGIREFGLWHIEARELKRGFKEFTELESACKFRDCSHRHEPGCAVIAAAGQGRINARRLQAYYQILDEIAQAQ